MTYGVNPNGFTKKTFDVIREEVEDHQRSNISPGLSLTDDTSLGSSNVAHMNQLAELWELAQALYSSRDPETANDFSLVQICSLTGTQQNKYSKTLVTGIVTLNPNKALPAGSVAHLTDRPNTRFITLTEVPADPNGGDFEVEFEAVEAGATDVLATQLSGISVAVSGWTGVTNTVAGVPGSEPEEDPELRAKRERELESAGSASLDAVIANVSDVSGVVGVDGFENPYSVSVGGLPPNSLFIIVRGGSDADIAQAIYDSKAGGINAFGGILVQVTDSQSRTHTIGFSRSSPIVFYADLVLVKDDDWNASTEAEVKTLIVDYVNSLGSGDDVIYEKITGYATFATGVDRVDSCLIGKVSPPDLTTHLLIEPTEYAEGDVANINITWTN